MNPYRMAMPPGWWAPKLRPLLVRLARPIRRRQQVRHHRLVEVVVRNPQVLREQIEAGHGILITPNHSTHVDAYAMYAAADRVGTPFYFMATWHVFDSQGPLGRKALQWHGCFSVDREGTDLRAFRQAVEIVQGRPYPLVIFPEGEVYHCNGRVTPFREGASVIALSAAKRAKRKIVCVPCAMFFQYVDDPTDALLRVMDELEQQVFWRPKRNRPLAERIYAFAAAILALKELEFLGGVGTGPLPERIAALAQAVLGGLEERHGVAAGESTIPERVKELRRRCLTQLEELPADEPQRGQLTDDLDDLFLVVQLFSYPGDYVAAGPSVERMAETLDKFEEDVLGKYSATIRGTRRATITFGEPVEVEATRDRKTAARKLTDALESQVQAMLDEQTRAAGQ